MKKHYLAFVALAAVAVTTSCSTDELAQQQEQNQTEPQTVTLTASVDSSNDVTRVGMTKSEDGKSAKFYWHEDDKIFVQTANDGTYGGAEFTTTETATGAESATFTGEVTGTVGQYAVYPYNENHKFTTENNKTKLTYNLPASYNYETVGDNIFSNTTDGTTTYPSNSTNIPMYGTINNNGEITFLHLGSLAVIRFNEMPVAEGTLTVTADQQLCGDFTVDFSGWSRYIKTTTASGDNGKVTFNFKGATVGGVGVFYLPLATGKYTNVKITVANSSTTQTISYGDFYMGCGYVTAIPINRNAYDIAAENDGVMIYYKFNDDEKKDLAVTYLYYAVENYSGKVTIPESVQYEGKTYPVTAIEEEAFCSCINLTSVTIPNSVTSIGNGAFYNCSSLAEVTMGSGVKTIGIWAFQECSKLTSITIPNGVDSIGIGTFYGCFVLDKVTIPNSVTSIGKGAFYNCTGLKSVTIGSGVKTIGFCAFHGCGLTSVTIPDNVTSIEEGAFSECRKLNEVTIGSGVTTIGTDVFYCCGLTSVTIPDNVKSIGVEAFQSCFNLESVTIGSGVETIGQQAFHGCSNLTSVTIPDNVKSIGDMAFLSCSKLASVTIGSGVETIGSQAFQNCKILDKVTIGSNVETIGSQAFQNCLKLTSIDIPSKVTSIGDKAFYKCTGLKTLSVSATTPPTIYSNTLPYTSTDTEKKCSIEKLYVPASSVDTYKAKEYWKDITDISSITEN